MIDDAPQRRTTAIAVGLAGTALAGATVTAVLAVLNHAHLSNIDAADPSSIVVPMGAALLGMLVAARRPHNPVGWLLLVIAVASSLQGVEDQYARFALLTHPGAPGAVWAEWLDSFGTVAIFPAGAVMWLLVLLPDGHAPSRRWRTALIVGTVDSIVLVVSTAFAPGPLNSGASGANYPSLNNPLGLGIFQPFSGNGPVGAVIWFLGLAMLLLASVAPLLRMRRAHGDERQQLKWIAYAVLLTAALLVPFMFLAGGVLPSWTFDVPIVLGFGLALPVSIGIAIFKHRLYDIDMVISRTVVYGSLAVFITAVYVGIAVGVGALIGGGGKPNLGLSILATAIVAVGFQPVRERVQRVANRLVYGKRATPYEVLSQFSERVAEGYAMDDVLPRMARVLAEGTGAERADVWLRIGETLRAAAAWPSASPPYDLVPVNGSILHAPAGADRMLAVRHQGEILGALSLNKRAGETLTPVEENLVAHLAGQAGLVLKNVGLTADLQARLAELRASRQRLVSAQDDERRRLERNLHDGAQQHLVAIKVKLGLAEMLASRDPEKARATLAQLKDDADEALETLRDLARGIYPPLLADKGLPAALESQARKATVPVAVEAGGVGRYSQEIEAAVYFCCLEALQNLQKYARATGAVIRLSPEDGALRFEVVDDGVGFDVATTRKGSGLTNMVDRLEAVGGGVDVSSSLGSGTSLRGWLPVLASVPA